MTNATIPIVPIASRRPAVRVPIGGLETGLGQRISTCRIEGWAVDKPQKAGNKPNTYTGLLFYLLSGSFRGFRFD